MVAIVATMFACDPQMDDKPDIGALPSDDQVDFTIAAGTDDFRFNITNTSAVTGIPSWDLGNGSKSSNQQVNAYYPLPGEYNVTLTLITKAGTVKKTKKVTQTKTDYSIFTDPKFVMLSGGVNAANGKTWVLDSLAKGHIGVGPAGSVGLEWWSADPLAKKNVKVLYDDKINFKVTGFVATLTNNGQSYVKGFVKDTPGYSNQYELDTDYVVDYNPAPGTWFLEEKNGKVYLTLSGSTPMFPCFDVGGTDGQYEVLKIEENLLELVTIDKVEHNAWHYQLIPEGYVKPTITFGLSVAQTANTNEYSVSLSNVVIPTGLTIQKVTVDFGDGTIKEVTDYQAAITNTYMRAAPYNVKVSVTASNETIVKTQLVQVTSNHPSYVPFLLDMMVVYNDFSEVAMAPVGGQDCSVSIVDNPSKVYPNKSSKVAFYSKSNNQWANAYMQLSPGYRFDLRLQHVFKVMVYGKAGDDILLKLENSDKAEAYKTGTADLKYKIKADNTWEVATFDFSGVGAGWNGNGDIFTSDVVADPNFNHGFYNVIRMMCNPGNGEGTHTFYFDDLSGPHVEGLKSATFK